MNFFLRRLTLFFISLFIIVSVTFFLMKSAPGDPFTDEQGLTEELIQGLRELYGLNQPWYKQYATYLVSVGKLDFGPSYKYKKRQVNDIIKEGFSVSVLLGLEALFISINLGIIFGCISAIFHNRWQDRLFLIIAVLGTSVPSFVLATILQYFFALKLDLFPIARWGTFYHSILPAIALSALPTAFITRLTRANMIEALNQPFIRAAKARGFGKKRIILRHALKNAIFPVIGYLGQLATKVLVGSFVIETIFAVPGLGHWLVNSIHNRDYTVIMGITVFYGTLFLGFSFVTDITYAMLDPRIRFTKGIQENG